MTESIELSAMKKSYENWHAATLRVTAIVLVAVSAFGIIATLSGHGILSSSLRHMPLSLDYALLVLGVVGAAALWAEQRDKGQKKERHQPDTSPPSDLGFNASQGAGTIECETKIPSKKDALILTNNAEIDSITSSVVKMKISQENVSTPYPTLEALLQKYPTLGPIQEDQIQGHIYFLNPNKTEIKWNYNDNWRLTSDRFKVFLHQNTTGAQWDYEVQQKKNDDWRLTSEEFKAFVIENTTEVFIVLCYCDTLKEKLLWGGLVSKNLFYDEIGKELLTLNFKQWDNDYPFAHYSQAVWTKKSQ